MFSFQIRDKSNRHVSMFQDGRLAIDNPETSNIVDGVDMLDAQILLDAFIWKFDVKGNDFALDMSFAKMVECSAEVVD